MVAGRAGLKTRPYNPPDLYIPTVDIPLAVHRQPLATLSGGFKLRVLLAQVLASAPDVLLLDEPTNHLDILSIHWLEGFLSEFPGPVDRKSVV